MRTSLLIALALILATARAGLAQTTSLDGDWNFLPDPSGALSVGELPQAPGSRVARVPGSWQSEFGDLRDYAGVGWYWRTVKVSLPSLHDSVLLHFGAVDYRAQVFVNGAVVGTHDGGYLPFEFDITSALHAGANQIALRVADPGAKPHNVVGGINDAEIPHGKQSWYVQTSGPWQGIRLEVRPRMRLASVHITAPATGDFTIGLSLVNPPAAAASPGTRYAGAEIIDPAGRSVWKRAQDLAAGEKMVRFSDHLAEVSLWSPEHPALYTLKTWLSSGDSRTDRFGFRTFIAHGGRFFLNGRPIYLRGALDQAFYPGTVYTPPSLGYLRDEMRKARSLGLNLLRCHIKAPDPRYLEAADETGMLVWYEIPNWDKLTSASGRRALETLAGMVERDWNHPAIVLLSLVNESWGVNLKQASDRAWLKNAYAQAKRLVPGWLVDDNSACCDNFHLATDVADTHVYYAIPEYAEDFDRAVSDLASRPKALFSPYGDAAPKGDEPLVLSEFGNWGLPHVPDPRPWWFARGFEGRTLTIPEGFAERFRDYDYQSVFPTLAALADATEEHEYESLKYEMDSLRRRSPIEGYVITEFTDVNWESNGLLDLWRRPKVFAGRMAGLQGDDAVVAHTPKHNFTAGENITAKVSFSHYGSEPLRNAYVAWALEGTDLEGTDPVPELPAGSAAALGAISFRAPQVAAPSKRALELEVRSGDRVLCRNGLDLFVYPPRTPKLPPAVAFHDPGGKLRHLESSMGRRGYMAPSGAEQMPVLIASRFDSAVKQTLDAGHLVILLSDEREQLAPGVAIVPRAGSDLDGNWISGFSWVRRDQPPFRGLAFGALSGFESEAVTPRAIIQGVPPQGFPDVLAGMFFGWLRSNVATLLQARAGQGKLLVCTLSLAESYGVDPYASELLDAIINYAVSGFAPRYTITLHA